MMIKPPNNKFIKILLVYLFVAPYKDIMQLSLPMDKQAQEKHILWKASDIICMTIKEELFQEQYRIFLDIFNHARIKM